MLYERCKIQEANIQYTEVINGAKTEYHFCIQCAKEMDSGAYSAIFDGEFPLVKLLSGPLGVKTPTKRQDKRQKIMYPTCGLSYEESVKDNCFGCANYYRVFDVLISKDIKQLQGSDCRKGKRPVYQRGDVPEDKVEEIMRVHGSVEEEMRSLETRLQDTIRLEEYEIVARCHDRVRELKRIVDTHENMEKGEGTNTQMV